MRNTSSDHFSSALYKGSWVNLYWILFYGKTLPKDRYRWGRKADTVVRRLLWTFSHSLSLPLLRLDSSKLSMSMKRVILSPKMVSHFETIFGLSIICFMLCLNLEEFSLRLLWNEAAAFTSHWEGAHHTCLKNERKSSLPWMNKDIGGGCTVDWPTWFFNAFLGSSLTTPRFIL